MKFKVHHKVGSVPLLFMFIALAVMPITDGEFCLPVYLISVAATMHTFIDPSNYPGYYANWSLFLAVFLLIASMYVVRSGWSLTLKLVGIAIPVAVAVLIVINDIQYPSDLQGWKKIEVQIGSFVGVWFILTVGLFAMSAVGAIYRVFRPWQEV